MSYVIDKQKKEIQILGDYVGRHPTSYDSNITTWHKSFAEIMSEASSAGFVADTFLDPKPLEEMRAVSLPDYQKLSKLPYFAIFRLRKM